MDRTQISNMCTDNSTQDKKGKQKERHELKSIKKNESEV